MADLPEPTARARTSRRLQVDLVSRIVIAAWRARRTPLRTDLGGRCREPGARALAALKLLQAEARGPSGPPRRPRITRPRNRTNPRTDGKTRA